MSRGPMSYSLKFFVFAFLSRGSDVLQTANDYRLYLSIRHLTDWWWSHNDVLSVHCLQLG